MALNDIVFQKQNGGMGRTAPNEDPISGLIIAANGKLAALPATLDPVNGLGIVKISFYEQLAQTYEIGAIKEPADDADYAANAIDYYVREFFRMSPTGTLYLAVKLTGEVSGDDVKTLQNYTEGKIRQIGILTASAANIAAYQSAATALETEHKPLSILFTTNGDGTALAAYTEENGHVQAGRCNVSQLIGCDLDPALLERLGDFGYYGCIGTLLGAVSKAMVHESIAWVQKFPLGLTMPSLITGDLVKEISTGNQNLINGNRYIFVRTHVGEADNYFNDSFTYDVATSDYGFIENVRTMDKATRGIRTNLLPNLNAPLYVDAATGKLRPDTVAYLETVASKALEDMEKAGELSGYRAEINPEQNVLATSQLEVQIKNVPVGVMRRVLVKIGYTTQI
ncbi:MAG: DUF2586 domain-containing protein [Prevotellaceae bacterium]|jgi:hypothetical protein|nr:DUF2586 domain-containing protein [Prevotellaceae bacterium]